jgi:hypothetical protein
LHYISNLPNKEEIFSNVVDFFNETWKNKPKPFKYNAYITKKKKLNTEVAQEIRETSVQKTVYIGKDQKVKYNIRKIKEMPLFVAKLNPNLSFSLAAEQIYFNYHFLTGLFTCCSISEIMLSLGKLTSTPTYLLSIEAKKAYDEMIIFSLIILQCMVSVKQYPESAGLQFVSRMLIFYESSKYLTKFIQQYDEESAINCALIVPYQLTQVPGNDTVLSMEKHVKPIKCLSLGGYDMGVVFSLSDKLNFMHFNSSLSFESDFILKPTEYEFEHLIVYVEEYVPLDEALKDFRGGFIVAAKNEIISYSFEMSIHFNKVFQNGEYILYLLLIGKDNLLVCLNTSIDVYDLTTGELKQRKYFDKQIKLMSSNFIKEDIIVIGRDLNGSKPILVLVIFESTEINIFVVTENLNLNLIYTIPSTGYECDSLLYSANSEYLQINYFNLALNTGLLINIVAKPDYTSKTRDKQVYISNKKLFKLNLKNDKIKLTIKFADQNNILLLDSNGCFHLIFDNRKSIKIDGDYDNGSIIGNGKLLALKQGNIKLFYFEEKDNLIKIALVRQISIHFDKITFFKIKAGLLYTASDDSAIKISILETTNLNIQYIDTDANEKDIAKMIVIDSIHVLCQMKNFK